VTAPSSTETERARLLEGFIEAVAELGYQGTSLEEILIAADIDPEAFHRHFADKEEGFLAAWEFITDRCLPRALAAFSAEDVWHEQMRAVGEAVFGYLMEFPAHARILYVEGPLAGEAARALVERNVDIYTELIDGGRRELDDPESLTRATAEGLAGAVYEQVSIHLARGSADDLPQLLPQLMFMVVRPYLGYEAAMRELQR